MSRKVFEGTLVVRNGKRLLQFITRKGDLSPPMPFEQKELDPALMKAASGTEVHYEKDRGQPVRVRPRGETWDEHAAPPTAPVAGAPEGRFHNPYNFVPAWSRSELEGPLGDSAPVGHERYHADRIGGSLEVDLAVATPLLIPDPAGKRGVGEDSGHDWFPLRRRRGKPYLAPTSIRGMLRSAYEAVTNSRFGVFDAHDRPLGYRMTTQEGSRLKPVRIFGSQAELLKSAWLNINRAKQYWSGLFEHGTEVWVYVTEWYHQRARNIFNVVDLQPYSTTPPCSMPTEWRQPWRNASPKNPPNGRWCRGWVYRSEKNIGRKHDERVFFREGAPRTVALAADAAERWRCRIEDYWEQHDREIDQGQTRPSAENPPVTFSRHIWNAAAESELGDGALCYAEMGDDEVRDLYPVNISRKHYRAAPADLIDGTGLEPAGSIERLSPADRVFGWAHTSGNGAYRGQVKVLRSRFEGDAERDVEEFGYPGLALAILAEPKPSQVRFYVAASKKGEAQRDGEGTPGYQAGKGLRGRKVYPHHRGLEDQPDHWVGPGPQARPFKALTGEGEPERSRSNRSIGGWVKPGARFRFRLDFQSLDPVELGALLWVLEPERWSEATGESPCFHRIGSGRPLGFGSARLTISEARLGTGTDWAAGFRSVFAEPADADTRASQLMEESVAAFNAAVQKTYGAPIEKVTFGRAYLAALRGFAGGYPVHYPLLDTQVHGSEHYEWFGANESQRGHGESGLRVALPNLHEEEARKGLPRRPSS